MGYDRWIYKGGDPDALDILTGLLNVAFDYFDMTTTGGGLTETWRFFTGGSSGGSLVRTIELVYTDTTKEELDYGRRVN